MFVTSPTHHLMSPALNNDNDAIPPVKGPDANVNVNQRECWLMLMHHSFQFPFISTVQSGQTMEEREQESHKTSYSFDHVWTSNRVFPTTPGRLI